MAETSQNLYLTHTANILKKIPKDDFAIKLLTTSLKKEDYIREESENKSSIEKHVTKPVVIENSLLFSVRLEVLQVKMSI